MQRTISQTHCPTTNKQLLGKNYYILYLYESIKFTMDVHGYEYEYMNICSLCVFVCVRHVTETSSVG